MKRIKLILVALFVCALGYGGYSAYENVAMTDTERFVMANIEALAIDEPGGGDGPIYETCYKTFTIWTETDYGKKSYSNFACVPGGACELTLPMLSGYTNAQRCLLRYSR